MDTACLQYRLTDAERESFDRDGYFVVEDVLPPAMVAHLNEVVDRLDAQHRAEKDIDLYTPANLLDFIGRDDAFLPLLDWPQTIAKVWDILGWNIQLYHSHFIVSPARPNNESADKIGTMHWHQDSGRLNWELETTPQPRISLKVAYFLTDATELGRANLYVLPGSHLQNKPSLNGKDPEGTVVVRAKPGDAVFFDRRILHRSSLNTSHIPRKVIFYGYSYRWLRPRDDMTVEHYMDRCTPIQRQLLCASPSGGHGYSSPQDDDVPLRAWMAEHVGPEAVAA